MRSYLAYSTALHAFFFAALFLFAHPGALRPPSRAYVIDFIGPSGLNSPAGPSAPTAVQPTRPTPAPAARPNASPSKENEFATRRRRIFLPRPSVLSDKPAAPGPPAPAAASAEPENSGGSGGPSGISADFPNFPYPWYITQVRVGLWNQWTSLMPRGGALQCEVSFTIERDGATYAIQLSQSSGNSLFDYSAQTAVQAAGPFPPLPAGFRERDLRVHVRFTAQQ